MADLGRSRNHGKEERRAEVIAAAARLFAERGFHGTSMDDIAHELGILKGSLYYWIDSKEALLADVLLGALDDTINDAKAIFDRQDLGAADRLHRLIQSHIHAWTMSPYNFDVALNEAKWLDPSDHEKWELERDQLDSMYKHVLRDGLSTGEFQFDPRNVSIVNNIIFATMNWFPRWYKPGGFATPEYIAEVIADTVINGILRREGDRHEVMLEDPARSHATARPKGDAR